LAEAGFVAKILIVDDHPELRTGITKFLEKRGYQTKETGSGQAAVDFLNRNAVDVVIADLYLPGAVHGIDVLCQHRKTSPKGVRILCTALLSDEVRIICQFINAIYLPKPFQLQDLIAIIDREVGPRD
jgi:two-component system OmpR family response regulator